MKVVVTGSLGHIGKPLTKELVEKGHHVTVISSKPDKQKDIEELGATAAIGLLDDAGFLRTAFTGADAVFAMVPPNYSAPDMRAYYRDLGNHYAKAIQETGVKHVVHLSSYGAHLDHGTGIILGSHDTEGILDKLPGVAVTHLRPTYFYYNLYNFVDMIKTAGFIGSNYGGDDNLVMVDPKDIAAAAAEELTAAPAGRKVRYVSSDERTANEVAQILGAAIGKPGLKWVTFSDEQTQKALEERGVPPSFAAGLVELNAAIHTGLLREDFERHPPATLGKVKIEDFAQEFAAAFK